MQRVRCIDEILKDTIQFLVGTPSRNEHTTARDSTVEAGVHAK